MSDPNVYQPDTLIELQTIFSAEDGVTPVDPTTVTLYVKTPDGVVNAYTGGSITRKSVGVYAYDLVTNQIGAWIYKWQGTGAVEITSPDVYFTVPVSAVLTL